MLIGVQSYSLRDRDLEGLIDGMLAVGITSCELWQGHVEPRELGGRDAREEMRRWRLTVPLDHFRSIRERFEQAGLTLDSYNISFQDHFSDDEIEGACRYLVRDRMELTGARWRLVGAEAVLKLRALRASGDFDAYWDFHEKREYERNHAERYAGGKPPPVTEPPPPSPRRLRRVK